MGNLFYRNRKNDYLSSLTIPPNAPSTDEKFYQIFKKHCCKAVSSPPEHLKGIKFLNYYFKQHNIGFATTKSMASYANKNYKLSL